MKITAVRTYVGPVERQRGTLIVREGGVVVTKATARVIVPKVLTCAVFGVISRSRDLLALCHIVFHGRDRVETGNRPTQYADNAVEAMARLLGQKGAALEPGLGRFFLVGSNDLVAAHYIIKQVFPRYGLSTRGLVADLGSSAMEREVWCDRGSLFVRKDGAADQEVDRLI